MNALLHSAPLLLRRRGAIADLLPVIAFAASTAITATVLGGLGAFVGRQDGVTAGPDMTPEQDAASFFVVCAAFACALLIPTAIGLGGSAARLSLARRERDLATIRLVGGTTAQVGAVAVIDVAAQALLGSVLGVLAHFAITPVFTRLDFGLAPFTYGELVLPWWGYLLLVVALVALATISAAISLVGIAVTPLGVARGSRTVRMSVVRILVWGGLLLAFVVASFSMRSLAQQGMGVLIATFVVMMSLVLLSVNVVGPFIIWLVARVVAHLAPTPGLLVGARRLAADPRGGWRAVSGITLGLVIAGFLTLVTSFDAGDDPSGAIITVGLRTGGMLTLVIAAVLAAVSTGVTQTARVIDQAPVLRSQHVAGAQVSQLHRARLAEIGVPLLLSSAIALLTSAVLLLPVVANFSVHAGTAVVQYLVSIVVAYALVVGSVLVGSPLVRRAALTGR